MIKIYICENPYKKKDNQPTHVIKLIPEDDADDAEWIEIGALWLTKAGDSWSGSLKDFVTLEIDEKAMEAEQAKHSKKKKGDGDDDVDIPD